MDTNLIKRFGLIAAGGVTGGIIGYFLGSLIVNQLQKRAEGLTVEDLMDTPVYTPRQLKEMADEVIEDIKKPKGRDYTKYAKGELADLVKPYTSSIEEVAAKEAEPKSDRIMIISFDEYSSDRSHNKEPITYYENDTTFANAQEDIIDNPVSIFGPNIHLHFGEENDDPDIVYVRNENNGVDYEISRIHNAYSVIVMGMPEEPPKETKAKRRRSTRKVNAHDEDEDEEDSDN